MGSLGRSVGSRYWKALIRTRLNNRKINRRISAVGDDWPRAVDAPVRTLDLSHEEYRRLVKVPALTRYADLPYVHTKPLEYLTTYALGELPEGGTLLDAAGGADAQYLRAMREFSHRSFITYSQDSLLDGDESDDIRRIGGSIDHIPLDAGSIDLITCHHSFEHFRGDLDIAFITEAARLLSPGGRLVIAPLFLTSTYCEIWNRRPERRYDPAATQIVDHTATFPGWGSYEGFARTYSPDALNRRVIAAVPDGCSVEIVAVTVGGAAVPDMATNHHQPTLSAHLKALVLARTADGTAP